MRIRFALARLLRRAAEAMEVRASIAVDDEEKVEPVPPGPVVSAEAASMLARPKPTELPEEQKPLAGSIEERVMSSARGWRGWR